MKSKWFMGMAAVCLLLAACGGPAPTAAPEATAAPAVEDAPAAEDSGRCGDRAQLAAEINLYSWVEYIDPDVKDQFAAECGVSVIETNYDSNETLLATLQAGGVGYDLIVPSDYMVQILIDEGMLAPLNFDNIPNYQHMGAAHVGQYFDPSEAYVVPYFWGTSGLAVDTNALPDPPDSWSLVFDPSDEMCGRISMLDDQRETIGAALMYLGYSLNDTDPAHLEEAKQLLIAQSACVKAYDSQTNDDLIIQGETALAHIWTGDAILAGDPDTGGRDGIVYVIPEEGCTIWQDNMAVPVGAPNQYTAEVFMNFLNDPEIAAQNATYVGYGTPNEASKAFIDTDILENEGIYPAEATFERLQWIEDVGDALELYDRVWTEFKAAVGGG